MDPHSPRAVERRVLIGLGRLSWMLVALMTLVVVAVASRADVRFDSTKIAGNAPLVLVFGAVGVVYMRWRYDVVVASVCDAVALLSALAFAGTLYTYAMTILGAANPLWDARLHAADRALGLDWTAYLAWLNARPALAAVLEVAYGSLVPQALALVILLPALGHARRLRTFLLAGTIGIAICGLGAALVPALGMFEHLDIVAALHHPDIALSNAGRLDVRDVLQLRGPSPEMRAYDLLGIIMFPSFHTVLAILFAWAFFAVPVLRWPGLALNGAMLAATPLSGGHYFADLGAGSALAALSLGAAIAVAAALERSALRAATARPAAPLAPVTA